MPKIKAGDRVVLLTNGKTYVALREPYVAEYEVDHKAGKPLYTKGELILPVKPINPKTGKPWQASIRRRAADFQLEADIGTERDEWGGPFPGVRS